MYIKDFDFDLPTTSGHWILQMCITHVDVCVNVCTERYIIINTLILKL